MDDRGFYLVLPSNVQPNYHTDNTASTFQTTFPTSYGVMGEWEVALTEVSYVNTIPTITNEYFSINSSRLDNTAKTYEFEVKNFFYRPPSKTPPPPTPPQAGKPLTEEEVDRELKKDLAKRKTMHTFTAKDANCPFDIVFYKDEERYRIIAKEDLPPNMYMFKREAAKLGFIYPEARTIMDDEYVQLWRDTLKRGTFFLGQAEPKSLGAAATIAFKVLDTQCLKVPIAKGFYPTVEKLVDTLNREMKHPLADWEKSEASSGQKSCGYKFAYNAGENRIMLGLTEYTDITFYENLHHILGFERKHYKGGRHTAEHAPLMTQGIYHIYIYCDLCSPIRVGNMLVPLLRIIDVPSSKNWGQATSIRFQRPMYIPVNKSSFNSVKIQLYDDTGRPITFHEGRTVITLHLRPRRL